jgi:tRNA1Val (adenine37-N6)-methyltransferase
MRTEQLSPFTLAWPESVFPLGEDALALGEFATVKSGWKVCDLGTGSGALLLLLARRTERLSLVGVERDQLSARTAAENLHRNNLNGEILWEDFRNINLQSGSFDLVIANPPYFSTERGKSGGSFRSEEFGTLEEWCAAAARLVKNGGRFALCHRPERLAELMNTLGRLGLEPKRLQFCAHSPSHSPSLVLLECVRQGKPGLEILPGRWKNYNAKG